jgi:hypothetical protein
LITSRGVRQSVPHIVFGWLQPQLPAVHDSFAGQTCPRMPQLFASDIVLAQVSVAVHSVCPLAHSHVPPRQLWVAGQACPHAPQLLGSFIVLAHVAPQFAVLSGHVHSPETHVAPVGHWWSWLDVVQPPQLFGSFIVSTQAP